MVLENILKVYLDMAAILAIQFLVLLSKGKNLSQKKVQVGKAQEKVQSEKDSNSKNRGGKKPN